MPDINEVIEQATREMKRVGSEAAEIKKQVEKDLTDIRAQFDALPKKDQLDPLVQEKVNAFGLTIGTKLEELQRQFTSRVDAVETALKRGAGASGGSSDALREEAVLFRKSVNAANNRVEDVEPETVDVEAFRAYQKAARQYLRSKDDRLLTDAQVKTLSVGSDPDGGYMVAPNVSARIIEKIYETSPIRAIATVESIGGTQLEIKLDTDETDFEWVGETDMPTAGKTPQLGKKIIVAHTMAAKPKATQQLLDDASVDMEAWLARKTSAKFARGEARAFVLGSGRGQPRGFLTYPDGTSGETLERIPSLSATGYSFEGLVNIQYSLKEPYHANASWLARRTSVGKLMLIKDGDGRYIFKQIVNPGQMGFVAALSGHPLRMADDMPDTAPNALALAFGDFGAGYTIVDRLGITVLRDPFSAKPFVEFYTRRRVGGDVVNFEAIKLQVIAAS